MKRTQQFNKRLKAIQLHNDRSTCSDFRLLIFMLLWTVVMRPCSSYNRGTINQQMMMMMMMMKRWIFVESSGDDVGVRLQLRCYRSGDGGVGFAVGVSRQLERCGWDGRLSPAAAVSARSTRVVPLPLVRQRQRTVADVSVTQALGGHQRLISVSTLSTSVRSKY